MINSRLKVSDNKRFLTEEDGNPFFWLGDTAWELLHRLNREETELYFKNRVEKGFTVIQVVVLSELDGLRTPNAYNEIPLHDYDPSKPNEKYFEHADWVISKASEVGLYIGLLPTWGDKVNQRYDWAKGPEVFSTENAFTYGKFLGRRYREAKNIIWILGGDRDPDERGVQIWRAMARGIIEGIGGKEKTLIAFHPQPFENGSSSRWFHHDDWLDFNMIQTGHDKQKNTFDQIAAEYALQPTKPVIDGEPTYEGHGLSFKPIENGYSSDYEVRKYAYWSLFSGAFGHTYGCHSIWQFYSFQREGVNFPIYHWRDALNLAGAGQMKHVRSLMTSRPMLRRVPDQSLIHDNRQKGEDYIVATRADDGSYAFVYCPTGMNFFLNTRSLSGSHITYSWFNPRDGISTVKQSINKVEMIFFQPPNSGYANDWVLVVDCKP